MKQNTQKKKIEWKKVASTERFHLYQSEGDKMLFSVRWKRSDGTYGSRRFSSPSVGAALNTAPKKAGLVAPVKKKGEIRLVDAFNETLKHALRGEKSIHDWNYYVKRFLKWLVVNYPESRYWHLLTRQIIREYLATYKGKSDTMRRLALQPIRQASKFIHREYELPDVADGLKTGSKMKSTPKEVYLADVIEFCDFVRDFNPRIEAGVALQGLAALQLQEATRLTWDKIDLEKGLVEISGEVKNEYRKRVIPVADRVVEALRRAAELESKSFREIVRLKDHVLISPKGCSYEKCWENYSKEVIAARNAWNSGIQWNPKDLRNCLPTFAVMSGLQSDIWEQYSGRAPRTVYARHYVPRLNFVSTGERDALDGQMELSRLHVVEPLNRAIAGGGKAKILNFFEPGNPQPADEFKIPG